MIAIETLLIRDKLISCTKKQKSMTVPIIFVSLQLFRWGGKLRYK
jgi:hypothetical protein